jgi:hypothetical protein
LNVADVELLFRQQFRRDLLAGRFAMEFAQSAAMALSRFANVVDQSLILILSAINMRPEKGKAIAVLVVEEVARRCPGSHGPCRPRRRPAH